MNLMKNIYKEVDDDTWKITAKVWSKAWSGKKAYSLKGYSGDL